MMGKLVVVLVLVVACVLGLKKDTSLTAENENDMVGLSRFEAKIMSMVRVGAFQLQVTANDVKEILAAVHPFNKFEETKENVVLMDEFPYVPVIKVPQHNASFVLSRLVLRQDFNPELIKVDLKTDHQSLYFVDIPMNASFDFRLNSTTRDVRGRVVVHYPHSWIHQNVEAMCFHEQPSLLAWEGRVDLFSAGIELTSNVQDRQLMDALSAELHKSDILKKYVGNSLQHQLAWFLGDIHWRAQSRLRDLCLICAKSSSGNDTFSFVLKADNKCMDNIPPFFWRGVYEENPNPSQLQSLFASGLKSGLMRQYRQGTTSDMTQQEMLGEQSILQAQKPSVADQIDQLTPRNDKRKSKHHDGFLEEKNVVPGWRHSLGQMYMKLMGSTSKSNTTATATNATTTNATN